MSDTHILVINSGSSSLKFRVFDMRALMRVDTAVHDDEFLDWDKPLSEQSLGVITVSYTHLTLPTSDLV